MQDEEKNLRLREPEESMERREMMQETMKERLTNLEKQLDLSSQQIALYQELQSLSSNETFRFHLLQTLRELVRVQKGIGNNLVEIGKLLEEKYDSPVKSLPKPSNEEYKPKSKPYKQLDDYRDEDEEDEEEEVEEESEDYEDEKPKKKFNLFGKPKKKSGKKSRRDEEEDD